MTTNKVLQTLLGSTGCPKVTLHVCSDKVRFALKVTLGSTKKNAVIIIRTIGIVAFKAKALPTPSEESAAVNVPEKIAPKDCEEVVRPSAVPAFVAPQVSTIKVCRIGKIAALKKPMPRLARISRPKFVARKNIT